MRLQIYTTNNNNKGNQNSEEEDEETRNFNTLPRNYSDPLNKPQQNI